jgi:ring-1,2-phenylacetyl-CoA epoxidase subunit PaaE
MALTFHPINLVSKRFLTDDAAEFTFEIPAESFSLFTFSAGQYLTFRTQWNGEEIRRSYSLCSAPHENRWCVGIKRVEDGIFSNFALDHLDVGSTLEAMPPMGSFTYNTNPQASKHVVLYAAGSGITPILSIIKTILFEEPLSTVSLFYGNKGFSHVMFAEELEQLKNTFLTRFRVFHIFSRESQGIPIQKGRIDKEGIEALDRAFVSGLSIDDLFVCGPESMILAVKNFYLEKGLAKEKIHFELFHANASLRDKATAKATIQGDCEVALIMDDDVISFTMNSSDENLLEAAQKAGADVPYACKGGVCCTCKAKIIEGSASMVVNYALEPDEVESGYVLTCQAMPTTKKITVSFDE